jgi:hypothetical protein
MRQPALIATPAPAPYSAPATVGRVASEFRNMLGSAIARSKPRLSRSAWSGTPGYDVVVAFWSSDSETGSPCSGAIVFTSSFNCWMLRYKLTLFAR